MKRGISYFSVILLGLVILFSGGIILRSINQNGGRYEENRKIENVEFIGEYRIDGQDYKKLIYGTGIDEFYDGQTIVLSGRFNKSIENKEILFTINNFEFSMSVNGKCVAQYGKAGTYPNFLKSLGFTRSMYSIERITCDDLIEIKLTYPYKRGGKKAFNEFINTILVGEKIDFYLDYINKYGLIFFIVTTIILISLFSVIAYIFLGLGKNENVLCILYFLIFVISGGMNCLMDSFYLLTNSIIPHEIVLNLIVLISRILIPISIIFFLSSFLKEVNIKKIATIIKMGQLIYVTIILSLQFFGIKDIYESQKLYFQISAVNSLLIFSIAIYEYIKCKNKMLQLGIVSLLPTFIGGCIDFILYYLESNYDKYLFHLGFIISCCIHLISTIKLINQSFEMKEREQKLKNELTNLKVSIMLSQIQPHFLYNALNAIQYICMEDSNKAVKAIEHFSKYLRGNMDSLKQTELIPFKKELNHLENYLYIEYLRFGDRVKVEYDLNVTDFLIPSLVIQPIVENAIRYGITRKVEGGTIDIITIENEKDILITISDDGIGFDPRETQYDKRSHIGIDNVRDRLKLQCNGALSIKSEKNIGTTISMRIPKEGVLMI